ncbi:MAG: formate dehydrogenase subunit delta [Marinobacter sp.]|uniref:formate dehydrogenase subunit delta n=1 Tax=Marinobacter sp. TaxID=50741 RepID=UPI0034A04CEA
MSDQQLNNLIKMINQISVNNQHHDSDHQAAEAVAAHLMKFWARSMKQLIISHLDEGGEGLLPVSRMAVELLREKAAA